jgi:hypothetical protein
MNALIWHCFVLLLQVNNHLLTIMPFKKGQSGNLAGRPPGSSREVQKLAREHTALAIKTLSRMAFGTAEIPWLVRYKSCELLLAYGWGGKVPRTGGKQANDNPTRGAVVIYNSEQDEAKQAIASGGEDTVTVRLPANGYEVGGPFDEDEDVPPPVKRGTRDGR